MISVQLIKMKVNGLKFYLIKQILFQHKVQNFLLKCGSILCYEIGKRKFKKSGCDRNQKQANPKVILQLIDFKSFNVLSLKLFSLQCKCLSNYPASMRVVNMSRRNFLFFFEMFLNLMFDEPSFSRNRRRRFRSTSFTKIIGE